MIPRSVLQRKQGNRKSVQKPVYRSQAEDSIQNGFAKNTEVNILATGPGTGKNACDTLRETVVKDVLCDILDLCSSTNNVTINQPAAGYRPVSVSNAIRRQRNPPLVDVGPLASTNKVPVYSRSRGPAPNKSASTSVCKGLAWEPNKRYSSRPKSQGKKAFKFLLKRICSCFNLSFFLEIKMCIGNQSSTISEFISRSFFSTKNKNFILLYSCFVTDHFIFCILIILCRNFKYFL